MQSYGHGRQHRLRPNMLLDHVWIAIREFVFTGVIVLINIICAIVFAVQVERDGQWILILIVVCLLINKWKWKLNEVSHDNVIVSIALPCLTTDSDLEDRYLRAIRAGELATSFLFTGSEFGCKRDCVDSPGFSCHEDNDFLSVILRL